MNYITVYEATKEPFPTAAFICFFSSILCITLFIIIKRNSVMAWVFTLLSLIIGVFLIIVGIWAVSDHKKEYIEILQKYKNGYYLTVEGEIEKFHPMPPEQHDSEHFYVNKVYFDLPSISPYGYSKCKNFGGDIKGNGQMVKIRYINYNDENVIMKLEIEYP